LRNHSSLLTTALYLSGSFGFGFQQMAAFLIPLRAHELGAAMSLYAGQAGRRAPEAGQPS